MFQYEQEIGADLCGYYETKLNQQKSKVVRAIHSSARKVFGTNYVSILGGSSIQYDSTVKYGGTLTMAVNSIRGRVVDKYSDSWGRWTSVTLQGKNDRKILFVSAYQVCARPTNLQGSTAYHQQETLARLERRTNHNPRKNFQHDLRAFLRTKIQDQHSVILAGDFNENLHGSTSGMQELMSACDMIDVWAYKHPENEFNTRHPGSHRIDFVLVTPDIMQSVTAIGYLPFHQRGHSDHRSFYLDLNTTTLFGNATNPLSASHARGVNSKDPFNCTTYVTSAGRHGLANNLFQLTDDLLKLHQPDHALVEKIDEILGQAMIHGDKKCKTRRKYWWSYKLHQERMWKSILKRRVSALRTHIDTHEVLRESMKKYGLMNRKLPNTITACQFQLSAITREIKRLESSSFDRRLEEKVEAASLSDATGNIDRARMIRKISQMEQQAETFRLFAHIRNPSQTTSLTHVEIPETWPAPDIPIDDLDALPDPQQHAKETGAKWRRVTQPEEINYYLRLRNRRHFGQAKGTPFTVPPLSYSVDWGASSLTAEAILEGNHTDAFSDTLQAILSECKRRTDITDVTGHVTLSEFQSKFEKWKESTTTSPSGRHLGLYKALFRRHALTDPNNIQKFCTLRNALIRTHVAIINYCLKYRYSLKRWQQIVNVMILKKPGDYRIHRLRVIHLYEADFNFLLGVKWRQLMHNAASNQSIHRSQYGGRPGCEATTLSFIEELKTDIVYCSRKPLINFDNDAAACYDRIIPSLASLVSRSFGQNCDVCFVHATTLQHAKFRLKTALGVSEDFYQHCEAYPIYGTGQGSGNSPAIWVFISSVLFSCHEQSAFGAIFETPDRSVRVTFSMVGFVDDSTGQVNEFLSETSPTLNRLVRMMEHDAQLWNDLLSDSGGLLEISKCSYHILYFHFRRDGTPYMAPGIHSPELRVRDKANDADILVKRLLSFESHETLGHFKAPSGNQSVHLTKLTTTGVTLARQLYASSASRAQALIYYWSIYIPSIRYTLPQSFFTPQQLHQAQAKSFPLLLAKMGFQRTMSYAIAFGPTHVGGAGFVRWATLQGEGQIMLFLKHWRAHDDAGSLLRVALAWMQFQAGTSTPVLQDVHSRLPHVESRWLPALRSFLASIDGQIITDKTYVVPCQRQYDEHIMDTIITVQEFTDKEIHILNCCRLYLNVITVSDLLDSTGTKMDASIASHFQSYSSHSILHSPVQDRPQSWKLWDVVMRRWFTSAGELRRPLGRWLYAGDRLRRTWLFYYDSTDDCIYHRIADGFVRYSRVSRGYGRQEVSSWQPGSTSLPIAVSIIENGVLVPSGNDGIVPAPSTTSVPSSFAAYIRHLPEWEQPLIQSVRFIIPPYEFLTRLSTETNNDGATSDGHLSYSAPLHIVSDGSHARDTMAFGWSFALPDGTRIAECSGPGYGPGTSHRAEAYGMLSAVQFLIRLREFTSTTDSWEVRFVSDNQGLITRLTKRRQYTSVYPNSTLEPDWDLVEQITVSLRSTSITPIFAHVKGHQDDELAYADLSLDAQMNVDADRLAGAHDIDFPSEARLVPCLPTSGAQLHLTDRTITARYSRHIRTAAGTPAYEDYIQRKNHWDTRIWATVNKVVLRRVIARHSHQYINVVKLIHDLLPTSAIRMYTDPSAVQHCELCFADHSTFRHVLRCPHPTRNEWRRKFLAGIQTFCENSQTRLGLMTSVLAGIKTWLSGDVLDPQSYAPDIRPAIVEQNSIGWYGFLRGFCSTHWTQLQDQHLRHNKLYKPTNTGTGWLVSLITCIWRQVFQLWEDYKRLVHGAVKQADSHQAIRRIQTKIRLLHERARHIRADDQKWLLTDLERYLRTSTLSQLHRWHATYEPVLLDAIELAKDESVANTRPLRTYFPPVSCPCPPLPRATCIQGRRKQVHDIRSQARQRTNPPRPKLPFVPSIRQYFRPVSVIPRVPPDPPDA